MVDSRHLLWFGPVMSSLKSFLMTFGAAVGFTPAALYERQRALVRHGVLKPLAGRGPGSGVELNSHSVATLLVACAASPSLSDLDESIADYCNAPSIDGQCPLTGKKTFVETVQAILEQKALMERVRYIEVTYDFPEAFFDFSGRPGTMPSSVFRWEKDRPHRGIESNSTIYHEALSTLCYHLKEAGPYERSSEGT